MTTHGGAGRSTSSRRPSSTRATCAARRGAVPHLGTCRAVDGSDARARESADLLRHAGNATSLVREADRARSSAEAAGQNRIVFADPPCG